MPEVAGAVVVAPGEGRRVGDVELLARSADTARFDLAIVTMAPGRHGPPAHVHRDEDDAFDVLEGELVFLLGDDDHEVVAAAGTFVLVPPGVRHTFANRTRSPVPVLDVHAPAGFDVRLLGEDG